MCNWQTQRKLNHAQRAFNSRLCPTPLLPPLPPPHCFVLVSAAATSTLRRCSTWLCKMQVDVAEDVPCPCSTQSALPTPPLLHLSALQLFSCKSQFLKCSNGNRKQQKKNAVNAVDLISPRQLPPAPPASRCSAATGGGQC